jgi:hypothetical protein
VPKGALQKVVEEWFPAWRSSLILVVVLVAIFASLVGLEQRRQSVMATIAIHCRAQCKPGVADCLANPAEHALPDYCASARAGNIANLGLVAWTDRLFDPSSDSMKALYGIVRGTLLGSFALCFGLLILTLILRPLSRLARTLKSMAKWVDEIFNGAGNGAAGSGLAASLTKALAITLIPTATILAGVELAKPKGIDELETTISKLHESVTATHTDVEALDKAVRDARTSAQRIVDGQMDSLRSVVAPIAEQTAQIPAIRQQVDKIPALEELTGRVPAAVAESTTIQGIADRTARVAEILSLLDAINRRLAVIESRGPGGGASTTVTIDPAGLKAIEAALGKVSGALEHQDGTGSATMQAVVQELRRVRQTLESMGS